MNTRTLQDANAAYNVAYDHGFRAGTATRADRIEALKAALQKIAVAHSIDGANAIARAALASETDK